MKLGLPTAEEWNSMIETTALERFAALDRYDNHLVELEGSFIKLGHDKRTATPNMHVLMENVYFTDYNGENYEFSHIWLNRACNYNPIWFRLKSKDFIKVRGVVQRYYHKKDKSVKYTLINVEIIAVNGIDATV